MKARLTKAWRWCKDNVFKKDLIVWIILAELIFWSPVITSFIMAQFNAWWYGVGSAFILFWAGPLTPAMPLQFGLALLLKKLYNKMKQRIKYMKVDFEADNIVVWTKEYFEGLLKEYKEEELLDGIRKVTTERKIIRSFRRASRFIQQDYIREMKRNTKNYIKKQNFNKIENFLNK